MNISEHLKIILSTLPEQPGIYQHINKEGKIIYIGKAKNLKRRVNSYFNKNNQNYKTLQLVQNIYDIKYIIVDSDQDAFLLENNLIKKYQPYYNILLKDGKSYPSICITNEEYPRIYKTRKINKKEGIYFGPYSFGNSVDLVLELISQIYPIRDCKLKLKESDVINGKYKVCLKYHIKKCCGVCENYVSKNQYDIFIREIKEIILGNADKISQELIKQMKALSDNLQFEEAEVIKRKYNLLENFKSKTIITNTSITDTEVYGYIEDNNNVYISILKINNGSIIQGKVIEYKKNIEEDREDTLSRGIIELRQQLESNSKNVILPFQPKYIDDNIKIIIPQKGNNRKLLDLAQKNAEECKKNIIKQSDKINPEEKNIRILNTLQLKLGLDKLPMYIEMYDNSSIQGTNAVSGCVVYKMGQKSKKDYKKFIIKDANNFTDDYASMREVIYRRYKNIIENNDEFPDLIIADGGIGQMNAMKEVLENQLKLDIPIMGLVKNNKHRTSSILYGFPPKEIEIDHDDEIFHFLTQIQDEVHRFAISFHRQKRSKTQINSELNNIKGIGENTIKILLKEFKNTSKIKEASIDDLSKYIGKSKATIVKEYFKGTSKNSRDI